MKLENEELKKFYQSAYVMTWDVLRMKAHTLPSHNMDSYHVATSRCSRIKDDGYSLPCRDMDLSHVKTSS